MKVALIVLLCISIILTILLVKSKSITKAGAICINTSDPEKDIYRLELDIPFGELDTKRAVIFEIRHE